MSEFDNANQVIHKVEDQWHYATMTKYGFVPLDETGIGFVRNYVYEHQTTKYQIRLVTGASADYFTDITNRIESKARYHGDLEPHLKKLKESNFI